MKTHQSSCPSFRLFCLPTYQSRFLRLRCTNRRHQSPNPARNVGDGNPRGPPEDPQRTPKAGLTGAVHLSLLFSPAHQRKCSEWTAVRVDGDRGDGTPTQRRFVLQEWVESDDSPPTVRLHVPARQDGLRRDAAGRSGTRRALHAPTHRLPSLTSVPCSHL